MTDIKPFQDETNSLQKARSRQDTWKRDERGGFDRKIFLIEPEINEEEGYYTKLVLTFQVKYTICDI